jgi:hypothetical protein
MLLKLLHGLEVLRHQLFHLFCNNITVRGTSQCRYRAISAKKIVI